MKKLFSISAIFAMTFFFCAMIFNPGTVFSAQKSGGGKPIPENVMKIAEKSCVKCHTEPGNGMALSHLNLGNWDKFTPEKQAAKAKAMCEMVTKDKMPPKKFREKNPTDVPSKEEIKTICDWAESIHVTKK